MAKAKENEKVEKVTTPSENGVAPNEETKKKNEIDWNEKVSMLIQRDPTNPKETDFCICVNGKIFQIQRGVEVMVPRYVKQAYLDSVEQLTRAFNNQINASEPQGKDLK